MKRRRPVFHASRVRSPAPVHITRRELPRMKNPNFDASNPLLIRPGTRFTKRLWLRSAKRRVGAALLAVASLSPFTGSHAQTQAQTHAQPMIVAHRGGTGDTPENTLQAFSTALADGADALWMTVQVTRDGVPVLYRPADLCVSRTATARSTQSTSAHCASSMQAIRSAAKTRLDRLRTRTATIRCRFRHCAKRFRQFHRPCH